MPLVEISQEAFSVLESSKFETASDAILAAMPKKRAKFNPLEGIPATINFAAWSDWVACRKERRKPITPRSASMQLKMLAKHPYGVQEQIINSSIQNDYTGLFEPKGGAYGQDRHTGNSRAQRSASATQQLLAYADALENGDPIIRENEPALRGAMGIPAGGGIGREREPIGEFQLVAEEDGTVEDRRLRRRDGLL